MSTPTLRHSWLEDAQALLVGTLLVALAVVLLKSAGLVSGGTVGVAVLAHYWTGWSFGSVYFVVNLPFYGLAWRQLGAGFALRTLCAVGMVSLLGDWLPIGLSIDIRSPLLAAVVAGVLMGNGFLVLFRHRASLGGFGILALWLQQTRGLRAGYVQMAIDALVVGVSLLTVPWSRVAPSIVCVVILNLVLAVNHRPGRYVGH